MNTINQLNARLLVVLGLSAETAQLVIDQFEELTVENGKLRTEIACLKQDLATLQRETAGEHPPEGETWPSVVREIQSDYEQLDAKTPPA